MYACISLILQTAPTVIHVAQLSALVEVKYVCTERVLRLASITQCCTCTNNSYYNSYYKRCIIWKHFKYTHRCAPREFAVNARTHDACIDFQNSLLDICDMLCEYYI